MECCTPGLPVYHQLPELAQTRIHWVSDAIQPAHPLASPSLPLSIFPSIRVSPNESVLHIRWPKYRNFSLNISPSNEYQDWFLLGWTGWISLQSKGLSRSLLHRFPQGGVYISMVPFQLIPLLFSCCVHIWPLYFCKYCLNRYVWNLKNGIDELIYWAGI